MYQRVNSIFFHKKVRRGLSIVCLVLLCLCNPAFSYAETELVTYGALTFRVYRESNSAAGYLIVNGYDVDKDSTGDVQIKRSYTDAGETKRVGGIDAEVFMTQTLSSLHIEVDASVVKYTIGRSAFSDAQIGMAQNSQTEDKCVIQGGKETIIGPYAFSGAQIGGNLKINITDGLICSSAFEDATISGVLQITGTIDTLEEYAFSGTRAKALHLSPSVTKIESRAFAGSYITEYTLETNLKTLGSEVFAGCEHLQKITLPDRDCAVEVAEDAFPDSEGLTIVIPEKLTDISVFHLKNYPHVVFQTAENLPENSPVIQYLKENRLTYREGENGKVNVPDITPTPTETPTEQPTEMPTETPTEPPTQTPTETPTEQPTPTPTEQPTEMPTEQPTETPTQQPTQTPTEQPTQLPTETPGQKLAEQQAQTPAPGEIAKPAGKNKKTYTIKKIKYRIKDKHNVVVTGAAANKLRKLQIPDMVMLEGRLYKVAEIEKKAFQKQKYVKTVVVGNYVTEIGDGAFAKCSRLTNIQFGTGVKVLGKKVLYQDKKLKKIIFKGKSLKAIGKKTFFGVPRKVDIRADKTMVKKYAGLINNSKK